ncbi:unnamed protein product [Cylindrotheca closterium]|uniref:Uncharacterized protein n=1 Tax=Cylindrotheca closterium TaxID=2856 RepID=A0AAD2CHP8_9STRA|nr:unnamed protein product [Cylindrotheca closterium]
MVTMQSDSALQLNFLWLWISLCFAVVGATIFQSLPVTLPGLFTSFFALKRIKASCLVIRDSNDQDLEMQPLEVAGQEPQLRKRNVTVSQAFRMAFRKESHH